MADCNAELIADPEAPWPEAMAAADTSMRQENLDAAAEALAGVPEIAARALVEATGPIDGAPWDAAVTDYERTRDAEQAARAAWEMAKAMVDAEAPLPDRLKGRSGEPLTSEDEICREYYYCNQFRDEGLQQLGDWKLRHAAAKAKYRVEDLLDTWSGEVTQNYDGSLQGVAEDALERLWLTPAPNVEAVVLKLRTCCNRVVADVWGDDIDTVDTASRLLSDGCFNPEGLPHPVTVAIYQDLLRLAGQSSPALTASKFDPEPWTSAFEAFAGHRLTKYGPSYFEEEGAFREGADDKDSPRGHALWAALSDWQKESVRDFGKCRAASEEKAVAQ